MVAPPLTVGHGTFVRTALGGLLRDAGVRLTAHRPADAARVTPEGLVDGRVG